MARLIVPKSQKHRHFIKKKTIITFRSFNDFITKAALYPLSEICLLLLATFIGCPRLRKNLLLGTLKVFALCHYISGIYYELLFHIKEFYESYFKNKLINYTPVSLLVLLDNSFKFRMKSKAIISYF